MKNIKILYYPYQIYKYLIFIPLLVIITFSMGLMGIPVTMISLKVASIAAIVWARLLSFFVPMFVKVKGKENIKKRQSYVVVANHQSHFDILAAYGWLGIDFRWVMKIELRKVPIMGYACYKLGHVFVDRKNKDAAIKSIEDAKARIKNGVSIFFFPEGTRSKNGQLLQFKKGAFRFALDLGLPILPVTISGTKDILPSGTRDIFPGKVEMTIHRPIDISKYNESNLDELVSITKMEIEKGLRKQL